MASLPTQTRALLQTAAGLVRSLPADAVLLLTEKDLDWGAVRTTLGGSKLLVAAARKALMAELKAEPGLTVLEFEPGPTPPSEWLNLALLEAVRTDKLQQSATVVALYNGISTEDEKPEGIDSLSIIHLENHLDRLTSADLRSLDTQVPLETLKAVVDLAVEIGREGREGHKIGTMFVVGDTRKVMSMSQPMNYNPFKGYSHEERDVRSKQVREQIKDIAQLEGAILIRRDGVAVAACMRIEAPADPSITLSMGLGTRHAAAARITRATEAIAVTVSQSGGIVRLWQKGEVVLHIVPAQRPIIYGELRRAEPEANGATYETDPRGAPLLD
jgi:DNA integrity scanning protein DisA with diadenylate cyclase activity